MARIRTIKPAVRSSRTVAAWPLGARLAWVYLWCYLDDAGRGEDDLRLLVAELFPADRAVTERKLDDWLALMATTRTSQDNEPPLCRYEVGGRRLLHAVNWRLHQRINRPQPSRLPACPLHEPFTESLTEPLTEPRSERPGERFSEPRTERSVNGSLGKGKEGKGRKLLAAAAPPRERDELWDTLLAECGIDAGAALTPSARGALNAALKQLREVGADPGQIRTRAREYRKRYPAITLTASALAKHWPALGGATAGVGGRSWESDFGMSAPRTWEPPGGAP